MLGSTARRRRTWLPKAVFVLGSFAAAGLVAAGVVSGADQPSISSDRSDYAPGDAVALSGGGWLAGEAVQVLVDDDQSNSWSHEAALTAGADGSVSDSFDLPDVAGEFSVTATAVSGTASASFTATAPTPPSPPTAGTPTLDSDEEEYAPGATVTLGGADWQPGDTVHLSVDDDADDAWDHAADVNVAADGTITDTFDLPDGLVAGFTATATDPANRTATATFETVSAGFGAATEPHLVRFASGTSTETQAQILTAAGAEDTSYIAPLRIHGVLLPGGVDLQPSIDRLRSYPSVTRVEPDRTREAGDTPNDSNYRDQWSLTKIGWENAFGTVSPSGSARVAILDTGIDGSHPDLDANVVPGTSILDGSNGLSDPNGHGTAMAGIVAAETDNGAGIAGVGYAGVQVMPVTVLDSDGTGQDSDIIEGVVYAADNGADVILMAFSSPGYSEMLQAAVDYAWDEGAVLVAATGNDGSSAVTFPAGDRGVIGVSNTDQNDALNGSSNYGQAVFLGAPGTGIATTNAGGGYTTISGTSAAAAEVAGAAALIKASSNVSNGVIVSRLAKNAEAAGTQEQTGNGRLNLDRAIADTSTGSIQPAGAAPVGGGGPFVGPYSAALTRNMTLTFAGAGGGSVTITVLPGQTVNAPTTCGGTGTAQLSQTVTDTCSPNIAFVAPGGTSPTATFLASPNGSSTFAGWSGASSLNLSTCAGTTNPCTATLGSGPTLTVTFNAGQRPTSTSVTCVPASVAVNQGSVCTATVSDTGTGTQSDPTGSVDFTRSGAGTGTFSAASCALVPDSNAGTFTSSCQVTYTPTAVAGVHIVRADYNEASSAVHATSFGTDDITVTLRDTDTSVSCVPATVALNQGSVCTATVDDVDQGQKSNPAGTVDFSSSDAGVFSSPSCTLAPVASDPDSSSCQVGYRPTANAGQHTITGAYQGSTLHQTSQGSFNLQVTKRDTDTSVSCVPGTVVVNQSTTCTATVSDQDAGQKSWPQGTVTFGNGGASGTFGGNPCTLTQVGATSTSSCSVTYTPTGADSGTHAITATYSGSPTHETSSGTFGLGVGKRSTTTAVSCSPLVNQVGTTSNCTATVTDTEAAGTALPPAGTVTFTFVNSTSGTTTSSCTLSPAGAAASSCTVSYSSAGPAVVTVSAAYGGSNVHKPSNSSADPVFVVFYDPGGGFVTGGGWVIAPPGSCTGAGTTYSCSPSLTGKANFGFVSKYKKGANVPDGNTEFQFHAAALNFKSTAYEWLVVAGSKAQFKGTGTINGGGNYTFQLFANDNTPGGTDAFRIKIWETATGTMIFDNKSEQAIGGGSIVVHKA